MEIVEPGETTQIITVSMDFDPQTMTALLRPAQGQIDTKRHAAVASAYQLQEKPEIHLTVIGSRTGETILEKLAELPEDQQATMREQIAQVCSKSAWTVSLDRRCYYLSKTYPDHDGEVRRTIVQLAQIAELRAFYTELNEITGLEFKVPFPHITLFSTSTDTNNTFRGIGIYSEDQFWSLKPTLLS